MIIGHPTKPSSPLEHGNKSKGASPRTISLAKSLTKALHCCVCNKQYKTRAGLYKHRKAEHPCTINSTAPSISCKESNCGFKCQKLKQLRFHLQEEHNMQMEAIRMDFNDAKGIRTEACLLMYLYTTVTVLSSFQNITFCQVNLFSSIILMYIIMHEFKR